MKITKENVEKAIADVDSMVDQLLEYSGKYGYNTRELPEHWGRARDVLAQESADFIANKGKKQGPAKRAVRGWARSERPVAVSDAGAKEAVIEIAKSQTEPYLRARGLTGRIRELRKADGQPATEV